MLDAAFPPNALHPTADRILVCAQCGIRFVWTGWEQQHEATEPQHCPGCRHLQALTAQRSGAVKWYDIRKGFGYITTDDGAEYFVHRRALVNARSLRRGQIVAFRVENGTPSPQAAQVERIDAAPVPDEPSP